MKIVLLLALVTSSAHAVGKKTPSIHFEDFACQKEVQEYLSHWEVAKNAEWRLQPSTGKVVSWKAHGKNLGEWINIQSIPKKETTLVHLISHKMEQVTFNKNNCATKKISGRLPAQTTVSRKKDEFTDEDLQKLISPNKNGIIYVWSPYMGLSKTGIAEIKKAATALGLPVELIMDPIADRTDAQAALKELGLPDSAGLRMASDELGGHSVSIHYPALVVYKAGKICSNIQRGWRDDVEYRKIVEEIFGECK